MERKSPGKICRHGQFLHGNGLPGVRGARSFIEQNQNIDAAEMAGTALA
jgi:hypothetical protein